MKIKNVSAREILDSRSNPTIEVVLETENVKCKASIPSGASTGSREAIELRDGGERFHGKGVLKAVNNVNGIIKENIIGKDFTQETLDHLLLELDGTDNKGNLGANAILGVSLAFLKCCAKEEGKELYEYVTNGKLNFPIPMINVINGGAHADNNLDIQEFMLVPLGETMSERVRCASEIFITLKKILKEGGYATGVGDEGGFAPNLKSNEEAFVLLMDAITASGYVPGKDVSLAIDAAASEFYEDGKYHIDGKEFTTDELLDYYDDLTEKYPIISLEDPFDENDDEGFKKITEKLGENIMIVGDDYFVSQARYLKKGIENKACNAILLKANQVGTITEFFETINLARENNYKMIISHRSGETEDTFIADLAVGMCIPFIKTGSVSRGERIAKYNRLMEIENNIR